MCGARVGGPGLDGVNLTTEAVVQGQVTRAGAGVGGAYVRLLDRAGEFTAEVVTDTDGGFRFFAAPGDWTLRTLAAGAPTTDGHVQAVRGKVAEVVIPLPA